MVNDTVVRVISTVYHRCEVDFVFLNSLGIQYMYETSQLGFLDSKS